MSEPSQEIFELRKTLHHLQQAIEEATAAGYQVYVDLDEKGNITMMVNGKELEW